MNTAVKTGDATETSAPRPGSEACRIVVERLEGLGYEVSGNWTHGVFFEGGISLRGDHVSRLDFSCAGDSRWEMRIHPPVDGSIRVIVRASGAYSDIGTQWFERELSHVESLFRARLVAEKLLAPREFATDFHLRNWTALVAAVDTARDRPSRKRAAAARNLHALGLQGPLADATSEDSAAFVKRARRIDADFSRGAALDLAIDCARHGEPHPDRVRGWLSRSARALLRSSLHDMLLAWKVQSFDRVVVGIAGRRDDQEAWFDEPRVPAIPAGRGPR